MWNCPECGCQAIAPDIEFCPHCFVPRAELTATSTESVAEETGISDDWGKK